MAGWPGRWEVPPPRPERRGRGQRQPRLCLVSMATREHLRAASSARGAELQLCLGFHPCSIHPWPEAGSAAKGSWLSLLPHPAGPQISHPIAEGLPWIFPPSQPPPHSTRGPGLLCIPDRLVLQEPSSENSSSTVWECSGLSLTGLSLTCLSLTGTMGSVLSVTSCRKKGTTTPCVLAKPDNY